jgi:hypothetical protein
MFVTSPRPITNGSELRGRTVHKRRALATHIDAARKNFSFGLANFLFWWRQAFAGGMDGFEDQATRGGSRTANDPVPERLEGVDSWDLVGCFRCLRPFFFLYFGTIGRQYTRVSCVWFLGGV